MIHRRKPYRNLTVKIIEEKFMRCDRKGIKGDIAGIFLFGLYLGNLFYWDHVCFKFLTKNQ